MDYSRYKRSGRVYNGAERKVGILIKDEPFIVKFRKSSEHGLMFNHVSEYLGSHIFDLVGIDVQNTMLGTYNGEEAVIIKDFKMKGDHFVPFNDVGDSSLERDKAIYQYTYEDIITMLKENSKLTDVKETIERFWDMYIVDALIGNFDRHGSNWGFLKRHGLYRIAPVFDNGSSLFPRLNSDEMIIEIMNSEERMNERIFKFPTSQILHNGKKSYYYDVINSLSYPMCNDALRRIYPKVDLSEIHKLIDEVPYISDTHKEFYKKVISLRYEKFIKEPYKRLKAGETNERY